MFGVNRPIGFISTEEFSLVQYSSARFVAVKPDLTCVSTTIQTFTQGRDVSREETVAVATYLREQRNRTNQSEVELNSFFLTPVFAPAVRFLRSYAPTIHFRVFLVSKQLYSCTVVDIFWC